MIIAITGMHRSGTSLFASWLQACGLVVGNGNLIPPYPDNPRGFFEDADFVHLQALSISRRAPLTAGWKLAPTKTLLFSHTEYLKAQELIAARQNKYAHWGWKDPRTTLFLEQWKSLLPQLKTIVVWRPCHQVVLSLLKRWKKSHQARHYLNTVWAIHLWQAYNRLALKYARRFPDDTLVFSIQQVISQDHAVLNAINQKFNGSFQFSPIQSLYEPDLLTIDSPSLLIRLSCKIMGSGFEEAALAELTPENLQS